MSEVLTRDDFAACLASPFRVSSAPGAHIELTLQEVSPLASTQGQETFSILFSGPAGHPLSQGIYTFEHDKLPPQEIFIVPVGRDQDNFHYEAIFNRLLSQG